MNTFSKEKTQKILKSLPKKKTKKESNNKEKIYSKKKLKKYLTNFKKKSNFKKLLSLMENHKTSFFISTNRMSLKMKCKINIKLISLKTFKKKELTLLYVKKKNQKSKIKNQKCIIK
jgi:hypothetical protein